MQSKSVFMENADIFTRPIRSGQIRKNVWYHQYSNGVINIMGQKYCLYSIKDAVKAWREKNPIKH